MLEAIRPNLTEMPIQMRELPIAENGWPIPWFVDYLDGKPEFRAADPRKFRRAIQEQLCWVCGRRLGVHRVFVLGPMCGITRTTSEPPCHLDCARWSARNCPFLARPHMIRREAGPDFTSAAGCPIDRNPGVTLLWITRNYKVFKAEGGIGYLLSVGNPQSIEFYAEGRPATSAEIEHSIETGLPLLEKVARDESAESLTALAEQVARFRKVLAKELT